MGNHKGLFLELLTGEPDQEAVEIVEDLFVQCPNGVPLEAIRERLLKCLKYDPSKLVNFRQIPAQQAKTLGVVYFPIIGSGSEMSVCRPDRIYR
ncbi:hypothetical protein HYU14_01410 [Candidatus Woesearchaeota archaeon]|nr:hypothetical protein [Candidatus Woesearchaeota archaeon]